MLPTDGQSSKFISPGHTKPSWSLRDEIKRTRQESVNWIFFAKVVSTLYLTRTRVSIKILVVNHGCTFAVGYENLHVLT